MEKSNQNQFNVDDISINSVYLNTFRKRKKTSSRDNPSTSQRGSSSAGGKKTQPRISEKNVETTYKTASNSEIGEIADSVDNITGYIRQSVEANVSDPKGGKNISAKNTLSENETAVRVCGKVNASGAVCSTEDGIFDVKGLSAHAMCPEKGINAASELLLALDACGVLSEGSAEYFFAKMLCGDTRGKKIGAACSDEMSGEMTVNIGTIASEDGVTSLGIDIRYPATLRSDRIISVITQTAAEYGVGVKVTSENPPLYIPCDHPLIRALGDCYTEITGQPMIPVAMGGGTYARALHGRGVAFGPVFSGSVPCNLHMADENFSVNEFMLHAEICYRAMCRLVTLENE